MFVSGQTWANTLYNEEKSLTCFAWFHSFAAGGVRVHGHVCGNNDGTTGHGAFAQSMCSWIWYRDLRDSMAKIAEAFAYDAHFLVTCDANCLVSLKAGAGSSAVMVPWLKLQAEETTSSATKHGKRIVEHEITRTKSNKI